MSLRRLVFAAVRTDSQPDRPIPRRPRRLLGLHLGLAALMSVLTSSCSEKECTELGCLPGLRVELTPLGSWKPGAYQFDLTIDGSSVTCQKTLPLTDCSRLSCSPADPRAVISTTGCNGLPADGGFSEIQVKDSTVKSVTVKVSRDRVELVNKTFIPQYKSFFPNGPECGPDCPYDVGKLEIPDGP